jgi:methionyl-tRNA synthetase
MHGTPILVAAEKAGERPEAVAAKYHALNRDALERLGVSFDLFTTTHTVLHERTAGEFFLRLLENGYLRRRTDDEPYCPKHGRFLPDRYLIGTCPHCGYESARGDECDRCGRPLEAKQLGNPRCSIDGTPAEFRPTEHFYLEFDRLAPELAQYVGGRREAWRAGTFRVAENFLTEGLRPTPITRDLDWGVPIPLDGYASKRIYVWFEALIGYVSASKEWAVRAGRPEAWRRYWDEREPARHYYFVGKDNRFHHTIVWPGMLLGHGGLHLPDEVPANEWLTLGGAKVSRTRTEAPDVFLASMLERFPPDVIRFYAALLAPQNHDTEFDWDEFYSVLDEVLANQFGNLVQRTLVLARDRFGGRIPAAPTDSGAASNGALGAHLRAVHESVTTRYEKVELKEALDVTLAEVREANRRYQEARPWALTGDARARAVYESLWTVRAIATWLAPVLPFSSAAVFRMLGFAGGPDAGDWDRALEPPPAGQPLGEIRPLFPRAEATPAPATASPSPPVSSVAPLVLRAATIRVVTPHPSADQLYVLEVDAGEPKPRTLVAGLRSSYTAGELVGRRIVVLTNLAPRTIRRMTSQGMLLAADAGEKAVLLAPPSGVPVGAAVQASGGPERQITYEEFTAAPLTVAKAVGPDGPGSTRFDLGGRTAVVPGTWPEGTLGVVRRPSVDADEGELLAFAPDQPVEISGEVLPGARVR